MKGTCPECDFVFTADELTVGETLSCPECGLTLQVREITDGVLQLEMIEADLPDWGE